jgi:AAHS family 4-hydroxybenzoate transporter-like MFS transporter
VTASLNQLSAVPASRGRWLVPLLSFLTILLDGFDTTSIGFVVPTLAREWHQPPAAFTLAFVMTSAGAVIGYLVSGRLAALVGRRSLILGAVLLFGLGTCVTAFVSTVWELALLRLITGVGLGAAIPASISFAVDHGPAHRRETVTMAVAAGLPLGATIAGIVGGPLIDQYGWASVFGVGGVAPLLLLPVLWVLLPRDQMVVKSGAASDHRRPGVAALFEGERLAQTAALWCFSFLVFTSLYALAFWIPTLLLAFGFAANQVSLGSAALGAGGVIAGLVLVPLTAWFGTRTLMLVASFAAVLLMAILATAVNQSAVALPVIAALGAGLIAGTLGQAALAVSIYDAALRTTGVGWSSALGRMGSIIGPAIGGLLLSLGQPPRSVLLLLCIPTSLAIVALWVFARISTRPSSA